MPSVRRELLRRMISVVVCCHSVKLRVHAARAFRSQSPLSKALQTSDIDLVKCTSLVEVLRYSKKQKNSTFTDLVSTTVDQLDINLELRRTVGQISLQYRLPWRILQKNRLHRHVENMIHQMEVGFILRNDSVQSCSIRFLLFKRCWDITAETFDYSSSVLKAEYGRWMFKWSSLLKTELPENVMETLSVCDSFSFANINTLLRLFATLPVTSECSFSRFLFMLHYGARPSQWSGPFDNWSWCHDYCWAGLSTSCPRRNAYWNLSCDHSHSFLLKIAMFCVYEFR